MHISPKLLTQTAALIASAALLIAVFVRPGKAQAQHPAPAVAQVGPGSPLPVYVVNDTPPVLPPGFVAGTSWKFTTWTTPSTQTFTASVQKTEGGWAFLSVNGDTATAPRWYFVPLMPGAWEAQ